MQKGSGLQPRAQLPGSSDLLGFFYAKKKQAMLHYKQIKRGLLEMWDAVLFLPNDDPTKQSAIVDAAAAEAKAWDDYRRSITLEQLERERNRLDLSKMYWKY